MGVIAGVAASADLDVPVPTCPGWNLADLLRHLGSVHRWATAVVVSGEQPGHARDDHGPQDHEELRIWFGEGAAALLAALAAVDPNRPTWTFGPAPHVAGFWSRRQAQEALIHAWDACSAVGEELRIDPVMGIDGLDEIANVMFPRQVRMGRIEPLTSSLAVVPDEVPSAGIVLAGDGTESPASADATLHGPAATLLLVMWRRLPVTTVAIAGDRDAALMVLSTAVTP